jgi:hypothetical protein
MGPYYLVDGFMNLPPTMNIAEASKLLDSIRQDLRSSLPSIHELNLRMHCHEKQK